MDCGIPVPVAPFSSFSRQRSQNHTSPFVAQRRFPDVSLFFEGQERAQRTKGREKGERRRFAILSLSLSHGPSRFVLVASRTCLALALAWQIEASEEEADLKQ